MNDEPENNDLIIVFDGVCKLCHAWVNFVVKYDGHRRFEFCSAQSEQGTRLMRLVGAAETGDPLTDYKSILLVQHWGTDHCLVMQKSDAALAILSKLGRPWSWLVIFRIVPCPVRDWVYDRVAANRYSWFGRFQECRLPEAKGGMDKHPE